jgi:hypothetical protein
MKLDNGSRFNNQCISYIKIIVLDNIDRVSRPCSEFGDITVDDNNIIARGSIGVVRPIVWDIIFLVFARKQCDKRANQ